MKKLITLCIATLFIAMLRAQTGPIGIGTGTPNSNAAIELGATNKGFLPNRVSLTATTSPLPLTAHIEGMLVYNTATAGTSPVNVFPGWYYNDGARWVRFAITNDGRELLYGTGAPTGSCASASLYTDTAAASPTLGQQWTCSGGSWAAYTASSQTEWTYWNTNTDAGGDKVARIERQGNIALNNGNPRVYFRTNSAATWSNRVIDVSNGRLRFYKEGGPEGTQEFINILPNGNVGINSIAPSATLQVDGSLRFPSAGTPVAGKVLTTDNLGNATWQPPTSFGDTKIFATGTYTCPYNGGSGGSGIATGLNIVIPSTGWYYIESGLTINSDCNDYWMYINTPNGPADIWRAYCAIATAAVYVPREQSRMLFLTAGTYPVLAGKTNGVVPGQCNIGNPSVYVSAVKVQN